LGFLFHHHYNGKDVFTGVKNARPYKKKRWKQLPGQIKLALKSWLYVRRIRNRYNNIYTNKVLFLKNKSHEININACSYNLYNDPFYEECDDYAEIYPANIQESSLSDLFANLTAYYDSLFNIIWLVGSLSKRLHHNINVVLRRLQKTTKTDTAYLTAYLER